MLLYHRTNNYARLSRILYVTLKNELNSTPPTAVDTVFQETLWVPTVSNIDVTLGNELNSTSATTVDTVFQENLCDSIVSYIGVKNAAQSAATHPSSVSRQTITSQPVKVKTRDTTVQTIISQETYKSKTPHLVKSKRKLLKTQESRIEDQGETMQPIKVEDDTRNKQYIQIIEEQNEQIKKLTDLVSQAEQAVQQATKSLTIKNNEANKNEHIANEIAEIGFEQQVTQIDSGKIIKCKCTNASAMSNESIVSTTNRKYNTQHEISISNESLQETNLKRKPVSKSSLAVQFLPIINIRSPLVTQRIPSVVIKASECIPEVKNTNTAYNIVKCNSDRTTNVSVCPSAPEIVSPQIYEDFMSDIGIQDAVTKETNVPEPTKTVNDSLTVIGKIESKTIKDTRPELVYKTYNRQHETDINEAQHINVDAFTTFINPTNHSSDYQRKFVPSTFYTSVETQCTDESFDKISPALGSSILVKETQVSQQEFHSDKVEFDLSAANLLCSQVALQQEFAKNDSGSLKELTNDFSAKKVDENDITEKSSDESLVALEDIPPKTQDQKYPEPIREPNTDNTIPSKYHNYLQSLEQDETKVFKTNQNIIAISLEKSDTSSADTNKAPNSLDNQSQVLPKTYGLLKERFVSSINYTSKDCIIMKNAPLEAIIQENNPDTQLYHDTRNPPKERRKKTDKDENLCQLEAVFEAPDQTSPGIPHRKSVLSSVTTNEIACRTLKKKKTNRATNTSKDIVTQGHPGTSLPINYLSRKWFLPTNMLQGIPSTQNEVSFSHNKNSETESKKVTSSEDTTETSDGEINKSDGELQHKGSVVSIGEIYRKPYQSTGDAQNLDSKNSGWWNIIKEKQYNSNWVTYYVSRSPSPDTSISSQIKSNGIIER